MVKLSPVGYGNHNNLHFVFRIGKPKDCVVKIKLVGMFDTGKAYITDATFKAKKEYFNLNLIKESIENKLEQFGFTLVFEESHWNNVRLKTSDILK